MEGPVARYGAVAVRRALADADSSEQAQAIRLAVEREVLHSDHRAWLRSVLPTHYTSDFAEHHDRMWRWTWGLQARTPADPYIAAWNRGGAKSTNGEAGVVSVAARRTRTYALYVCDVQGRADDHVGNIGSMFESPEVRRLYPALAERKVGLYGQARGWRRNRLRTASGFTVDAIGLDTAARGVKIEDARPDLIVLDDLDDALDGPGVVRRKIDALTKGILPAGARHVAVLGLQNLVHANSIFSRLVGVAAEPADFLAKRQVSGPIPAVADLQTERVPNEDGTFRFIISGGTATWSGMDLDACQHLLDEIGLTAFMSECQHDVEVPAGGIFSDIDFVRCRRDDVPALADVVVAVDPAVTDTDESDSQAVQVAGLAGDGRVYRLRSWEQRSSPVLALRQAITWAYEEGASTVLVETDQGGDTWESVYREAHALVLAEHPEWAPRPPPRFEGEKAGAGHGPKAHRGAQMVNDYMTGRIVHVEGPTLAALERALYRFPRTKPLDLADACLVESTPVLTGRGWRAIADVRRGDRVQTRAGWRRVRRAGRTGRGRMVLRATFANTWPASLRTNGVPDSSRYFGISDALPARYMPRIAATYWPAACGVSRKGANTPASSATRGSRTIAFVTSSGTWTPIWRNRCWNMLAAWTRSSSVASGVFFTYSPNVSIVVLKAVV